MAKLKTQVSGGVALAGIAALLALAGCSKPSQGPSDQSSASAPATAPAADSGAPAADASATPAASDYGTATQPGPGKLKLDIKVASGDSIYGDPASGQQVFNQCMTCHVKDPGVNRVGPSLHGIINRHSGMIPGFNYSAANKGSGIVWTEQELYTYLENPQKTVPGTYMTYTGVKDPQKRADVIAYLQENTK